MANTYTQIHIQGGIRDSNRQSLIANEWKSDL